MSEQNEQSQSFEQSMARLEQIVRAMERGDVPLEESLKLFEEGTALVRRCSGLLPRKKGRSPWLWGLGLAIIGAGVSLLTAGVLSPAVATNIQGAFFEMIRGISILGVAERFEAVVAAAMTLGWFCLLSLLLTAAGHLGETLHQGWGRPTVWLTALLAAAGQAWAREVSPWFSALGALVFWCLLPLLGRRRAPVEKKNKI